jgi:hypothetical protein
VHAKGGDKRDLIRDLQPLRIVFTERDLKKIFLRKIIFENIWGYIS